MRTLIVTRHPSLVELIRERYPDLCPEGTEVVSHIEDPNVLDDAHVIGVLPPSLAARCEYLTEIPLALTPEDRGRELDLARLREIAGKPRTYVVREVGAENCPVCRAPMLNKNNACGLLVKRVSTCSALCGWHCTSNP